MRTLTGEKQQNGDHVKRGFLLIFQHFKSNIFNEIIIYIFLYTTVNI